MANIKTLKDSNNEIVYPQTVTSAIFSSDSKTLEAILNAKMDADKAYTKEEVNTMISALSSLKISVLQEGEDLPAVGSTDTIYLKKKTTSQTQNAYDEYIYLENGTYEKIGDTEVDLTAYLKTTDADTKYAKLEKYGDTTINIGRKSGTTVGAYSTAEGLDTEASGTYSHAEGNNTIASNFNSHAEGGNTTASGDRAHAEGSNTKASGNRAHAEGAFTKAEGDNQHVQGKYNIADTTSAHIVGNGSDSSNRSNAHTLDWSGNSWYQGTIKTGGTSYDNAPNTVITSGSVVKVWTGTQTDYDAITTKDSATLYLITG